MATIKLVKPTSESERHTKTTVDTLELTPSLVASWKSPPFQRDLKINARVMAVAEEIRGAGGVIPGILTIGVIDSTTYVVDGQHRLAAWMQTGLPVGYADVRMHWFDTMGQMANEFVRLNSALVKLRPDDILRGLEPSTPTLQKIRQKCRYVGYDAVRRSGNHSPVLSMSVFIRTWMGTRSEVPQPGSSLQALAAMDELETEAGITFIGLCFEAWRRDPEYARLWGALNLMLCGWLYRRVVSDVTSRRATSRTNLISPDLFRKGLLACSAETAYLEYLVGRNIGERDRAPAYARLKSIFQRRCLAETGSAIRLPSPSWAHQ